MPELRRSTTRKHPRGPLSPVHDGPSIDWRCARPCRRRRHNILPAATCSGQGSDRAPAGPEVTGAHIAGLVEDAASSRTGGTGEWTTAPDGQVRTADGQRTASDLPRGATVRYFGDYEIQKELGRGGMGVVYKARQVSLNRSVALKMIKAGVLADSAELQRFQNEAEAVALLDHAGIVPVYEVGEHDGQRYFSMKLVEGGNLAESLPTFMANPSAAARLMAQTAEAVHHAHMRGILHRDLKPANVLVDAEGHPHVTDFGLAKRVEGDVEMTQSGAILGTPAYMSPEQATGRRGSITTATDVYGLGAILYALLAGQAPFGGDGIIETLDAVRTRPPESPRKLNAHVPRDLETICLKCLEKDPRRRYASAHALADDLDAWQRPESGRSPRARVGADIKIERAWALVQTPAGALAGLSAATLIAVVAGATGMIAVQAKANTELRSSNTMLDVQRRLAQDREQIAIDSVKRYGDIVRETPELKNSPDLSKLRTLLLKEPRSFFKKLRDQLQLTRDTTPDSLTRLAAATVDLGLLTDEIGDRSDALRIYHDALTIYQRLARENLADPDRTKDLARIYSAIAYIQGGIGQSTEALASYGLARLAFEALVREQPSAIGFQGELAEVHTNTATLQKATGRQAEALASYESSRKMLDRLTGENPKSVDFQLALALCHGNIGDMQGEQGRTVEALASLATSRDILEPLARENPAATIIQRQLAASHSNLGSMQVRSGRLGEALNSQKRAREILEVIAKDNPSATAFQSDLAASHNNIGALHSMTGHPIEAASASQERARAIHERLARENPSVTRYKNSIALTDFNIGICEIQASRMVDSIAWLEKGRAIWEALLQAEPSVIGYQRDLSACLSTLGAVQAQTGRKAPALASLNQARSLRESLLKQDPGSPILANALAGTLNNLAELHLSDRQFDSAKEKLLLAIEWQRKAIAANPHYPHYRRDLASHLNNLARANEGLGQVAEAAEARRQLADLAANEPSKTALDPRLAAVRNGQAPKDAAARIQLALRANEKGLHWASARLYAETLANDPELARDRQSGHRYNAACAASLAATGKGKDDPAPDDAAKAKLRRQALGWLKAELAVWAKLLEYGPPEAKAFIAQTLKHWQEDADLASMRGDNAIDGLPETERAGYRALWADVAALLQKAGAAALPSK